MGLGVTKQHLKIIKLKELQLESGTKFKIKEKTRLRNLKSVKFN